MKIYIDCTEASDKTVIKTKTRSIWYINFDGNKAWFSLNKKLAWITGPIENVTNIKQMTLLYHVPQIDVLHNNQLSCCRRNFHDLNGWSFIESNKSIWPVWEMVKKVNLFQSEITMDFF